MTAVELPALNGHDHLGFLAALGLLRLLTAEQDEPVRLRFDRSTGNAVLHSHFADVDAIAHALTGIVTSADPGAAIPGIDPRFPLRAATRKDRNPDGEPTDESDPMRVPRDQFLALYDRVHAVDPVAATVWLPVLVTDQAVDARGRTALNLLCAPAGKQNLRTFFLKSLEAVRANPSHLPEALSGWRRIDHFTGEYLDHRAIRDAADHPRGRSVEAGVPGATWLATMAMPLLRLTGNGERPRTTLWHRVDRRALMVWPLWHPPLDVHAVQTIIEHPSLRPTATPDGPAITADLRPLGVFGVGSAERQPMPGRKSAGVLAPATVSLGVGARG